MKSIISKFLLLLAFASVAMADFQPGPFKIWDGTNNLTIDASGRITVLQGGSWSFTLGSSIPTGSNVIGKLSIDQTTPGTTNLVAAGQNGTWNITNISGSVSLPTGAATSAKQPAYSTAGSSSADVLSIQGVASGTPIIQNQTQVNGTAVSVNNGTTDAGTQRVSISSDSTGQVKLATGANTIGALTANQSVNTAQINGVTPSMNQGAADTGTQRVALANDQIQDSNITGQTTLTLSNNVILASAGATATDCNGYHTITMMMTPIGTVSSGTVTFEASNDNSTFIAVPLYDMSNLSANPATTYSPGTGNNRIFTGAVVGRYFRARLSLAVGGGGTLTCFTRLTQGFFQSAFYTMQQATAGNLNVTVAGLTSSAAIADGQTNPSVTPMASFGSMFNGATWDRARNDWNTTTGDTGAKTVTFNGATQLNYNSRGAYIYVNVGTVSGTTPTMAVQLQVSFDTGTTWVNMGPAAANLTTTSTTDLFIIYPANSSQAAGVTPATLTTGATNTIEINMPLPRSWRLVYTIAGTTPSFTITNVQVAYVQ
jgi:hypothetical protein